MLPAAIYKPISEQQCIRSGANEIDVCLHALVSHLRRERGFLKNFSRTWFLIWLAISTDQLLYHPQ